MCDFADGGLDNLVVAWHNKACVDLFAGREHLMDDWLPVLLSLAIPTIDGRPHLFKDRKDSSNLKVLLEPMEETKAFLKSCETPTTPKPKVPKIPKISAKGKAKQATRLTRGKSQSDLGVDREAVLLEDMHATLEDVLKNVPKDSHCLF